MSRALAAAFLLALAAPRARAALADDALAARDAGRLEDARALWTKASESPDADGFVWSSRGWSELAVGRARDARASFARAFDRAATPDAQAEASLGLGLTLLRDGKTKDAAAALVRAGSAGPYALELAARLRAQAALSDGDRTSAQAYLRQALELDSRDREALRLAMDLLEREGSHADAWRLAERALRMDPLDAEARRVDAKASRKLPADRDAALGVRRLRSPVLSPSASDPPLPASTATIRVGLYGAASGRPAILTSCVLVPNSADRVAAASAAASELAAARGAAAEPRLIEFDAATGRVEVRDLARRLLLDARGPFRLEPSSPRGSILVSSARLADADGSVDPGDREPRGAIEVFPGPRGFTLVAESPLETYLYGVVSLALPDGAGDDAWSAEAVVARSAAQWAAAHRPDGPERFDVVDGGELRTIGVSGELRAGAAAVAATEGLVLTEGGAPAPAPQHEDSGGWTEDGVADFPDAVSPPKTPLELERFLREPPRGLYGTAGPGATPASSRWIRLLDARDLRERVARRQDLGRLAAIRVASRAPGGRVSALEVVGAKGRLLYEGDAAIEELLSPGSLRSTLFALQPLGAPASPDAWLVWGAGTGSGRGFSRAGAVGRAALGAGFRDILKRYFPRDELSGPAAKK
jgi:peptidoglycan hydrolase-like amidase/tetratricopeptide (TPR) repeat protein